MTRETFLWHDYETWGANPRCDRPCQFAALRTDSRLEPVGEPVVLFNRPTPDVLPVPEACLITGITPQQAERDGLPEYEFARRIDELMSVPGTCSVGYNNFRFDDEVTRFLLWRNFRDPYAREYKNGNSRFDLIDVLRLMYALRPDGIEWPRGETGAPVFRLEDLARANGLDTANAHDAMADVVNTLGMARRVVRHQPRMWAWCLELRQRHRVEALVEPGDVLLHVSSRYPATESCIAPVLPLIRHPKIQSQWLVWNLRHDPRPFLELDPGLLEELYWTPRADLPDGFQRLPIKWLRTNRCPMIAPTAVLDAAAAERTTVDLAAAERHADRLRKNETFLEHLRALFDRPPPAAAGNPDTALYEGFPPNADRPLCRSVTETPPDETARAWAAGHLRFQDERLAGLIALYLGRHAEDQLDPDSRREWQRWRRRCLVDDPDLASIRLPEYRERLDRLRAEHQDRGQLLDALEYWANRLRQSLIQAS